MRNLISLLIVMFISLSSIYAGGPWPQSKGKAYVKLSEWWTIFDKHYTDSGQTDPNLTTGIFNTSLYAEYGITNRLTTVINAPLFSRNYMNNLRSQTTNEVIVEGESINTIGDIDLGFKYGLTKPGANIPISVSLTLGLPTGNVSGGKLGNLQTSDGEFNQILQIDAGTGFKLLGHSAYTSLYTGFNHRTNGFSEEFRWGVEFGIGLFNDKLWLNTKLNAVESLKNGDTAETITSTSLFANNSEFTSVAFEANVYLTSKFGVSASIAGAVRGEIIAAASSYNVGIFYDFN